MRERHYYTYILTNLTDTTVYVGVTNDICRRIWEHKQLKVDGFPKKYKTTRLVYYEQHLTIAPAIKREKLIKRWNRSWKDELITTMNPEWVDLYNTLVPD